MSRCANVSFTGKTDKQKTVSVNHTAIMVSHQQLPKNEIQKKILFKLKYYFGTNMLPTQ